MLMVASVSRTPKHGIEMKPVFIFVINFQIETEC